MKHWQTMFGNKVKELRREAGFSQEALADEAGIHRSHLGKIERGTIDITLSTMIKIARILQVKPSVLLYGIGSKA
jgi:transcriptional regulator with XRE-family HTH domain